MTEEFDVAVVGGGVSGLAAAYELRKRKRSVVVLERDERPGASSHRAGRRVRHRRRARCAAGSEARGRGAVQRAGPRRSALPYQASAHRFHPAQWQAAFASGFLDPRISDAAEPLFKEHPVSAPAKLRMAAELFVPRRRDYDDESIADFVRRRFGPEAVMYIAEPLLAGIHAGDVERLSVRALFPRLVDAEARAGSVMKAFRRERGAAQPGRRVSIVSRRARRAR